VLITCWKSLTETTGKERELSWDRLAEWLAAPVAFRGSDTPGWSAAAFIGSQRRLDRCTLVSALVLDFDDGKAPLDVLAALFSSRQALAHTSKSHTAANPSYRVVLGLSRAVLPAEHSTLWSAVTRPFAERVDQAAKDCSRFWFVPCRTEATEYAVERWDGEPLDVDAILDAERALAAKQREASQRSQTRRPDRMGIEERASRYVAKMDPSISGSGGHGALWAAALALVKGFSLSRSEADSILTTEFNPRCTPPWSKREIDHKLDNAEKAKLDDGYLLGDSPGYEYRAPAPVPPPCPPPPGPPMTTDDPNGPDGIEWTPDDEHQPEETPHTAVERLGIVSIQKLCLDVLTDVNKPRVEITCRSGIAEIDAAIGGYRAGMVTVLGASTNFGKTTFSIMSADLAAKSGKNVIYCTFEDSPLLYGRRIVARRGGVNATKLRDGDVSQDDRRKIVNVAASAEKEPFMFPCIGMKAEAVARGLVDVSRELHVDLVIVDYIQRVRTEQRTQDRRNEVTLATELLTNTIKNIGAAGLVLSQLKRLEPGERPTMAALKESGDIENMAEHIILGYSVKGDRKMFLEKNKDGPVIADEIDLRFDFATASFLASNEGTPEFQYDTDDLSAGIFGYD
jgi:hypothetical protein